MVSKANEGFEGHGHIPMTFMAANMCSILPLEVNSKSAAEISKTRKITVI